MEKDKRKRSEKERKEGIVMEAKKKKKVIKKEEEEAAAAASEEEVEEFLAILGRMKAVVKFFNKGSGAEGKGWRAAAVEAEKTVMEAAAAKDVIDNNNRMEAVVEKCVLDLNEAPEEEPIIS